jgi:2-oxoglutarate dehydrogenase E2 component (dihydrolipoamide succinyltransferase)
MAKYEIRLPRLGEGVIEATLIKWLVSEGEMVTEEDPIAEIATDKVDTELPAPVSGKLISQNAKEGDVVEVGALLAILEIEGDDASESAKTTSGESQKEMPEKPAEEGEKEEKPGSDKEVCAVHELPVDEIVKAVTEKEHDEETASGARFYSPLVRRIAQQENLSFEALGRIKGSGKNDRLTKQDLLNYLEEKKAKPAPVRSDAPVAAQSVKPVEGDEVIEMDRIRQLIATHMVKSVQTSPHVTSFVEVDMTPVVLWRERQKIAFLEREGIKLTYTPIIIEAIARAVREVPMMNVSVDGTKILKHKNINVGMAVALPSGNLIVPVIREASEKNLLGITKKVNDLAERARDNKLIPDEITGGTISLTNLGSFGTLAGTPIINQPQAAIVATGAIVKKPVVIETPTGDTIGIRHRMILSVTFDHRVIDGALAGTFLNKLRVNLEQFDTKQTI